MKRNYVLRSVQASVPGAREFEVSAENGQSMPASHAKVSERAGRLYQTASFVVSGLLALAVLLTAYSAMWEFSTRKYLKGFSDAIVPVAATPEQKIEAILDWMAHGPARQATGLDGAAPHRDPIDTLNYQALLQVCGTATNAFINLGDSVGLVTRRLLLLDSQRLVKHVSAEVLVNGGWIVVDPAFRVILRGPNGQFLTREQLADPATLAAATKNVPGYNPLYSYESTAHIRLGRLPFFGLPLRRVLGAVVPGWEDSPTLSLLAERESLAVVLASLCLVILLLLIRASLRWYGEHRLGLHAVRMRERIWRALGAFMETAG